MQFHLPWFSLTLSAQSQYRTRATARFVLLGLNASATARSYRGGDDDDDEMSVLLVEETGVPGGHHRPMASN